MRIWERWFYDTVADEEAHDQVLISFPGWRIRLYGAEYCEMRLELETVGIQLPSTYHQRLSIDHGSLSISTCLIT